VRLWIHRLGSMKIAVVLLVIVLVAMAVGTIVESTRGTATAMHTVYGAVWFWILLGLFGANILCSLIDLFPWGGARIGFVLTHGSMLIILCGALVTQVLKVEGSLALWEGEEGAAFTAPESRDAAPDPALRLPFTVRLESFEIDYYQGTQRPAMFRSRVTVKDPERGASFPAIIEMNRELSYRGYRLFQSSYQQAQGRDQTVLAVSRDPGQPIVFLGYVVLMLGMTVVLATRIAQRRAASRLLAAAAIAPPPRTRPASAALVLALALTGAGVSHADEPAPPPTAPPSVADIAAVNALRRLPVQHDGRVMPLDTLAREAVFKATGRRRWQGADPVATVLGWVTDPERWAGVEMVPVPGAELAGSMGLPAGTTRASFRDFVSNHRFLALLEEARAAEASDQPLHGLLKDVRRAEDRLVWMQGFLDGSRLRVLPGAQPGAEWSPPSDPRSLAGLDAILKGPPKASFYPTNRMMEREILYNRARPSRLAWWVLLGSAAVSILGFYLSRRWLEGLALVGLLTGFGVMTWGIVLRWQIAGRIPASNMYESMLFLGWGVGLFALVAFVLVRNRLVIVNATAMSALAMALADLLPIDPFIHPVPPVLAGTVWLAIHVPIIMVSYSVLALGVVIAHMRVGLEIFAPRRRELASRMSDLLYWYVHIGSILLIVGILTGSIWASSSWGRYWGWDPKEVWSLIAFLAYMAILHGRMDKILGPLGVAALSIAAFWMILMTYIGVNFVLTSGMHSYGFGSSSVVKWFALIALVEVAFIGAGFLAWRRRVPRAGALATAS